MPEETVGYVHLEWTCKACGTRNEGKRKVCASCGAQMSEQDQFEMPAQQQMISDEAEKVKAARGPDMMCPYCNTRNPADATRCSQCNGDLVGAKARAKGQVLGAYSDTPAPEVPCPFCSTPNPANAYKCRNCGGSLAKQTSAPTPAKKSNLPMIFAVLAGIILIACGAIFALRMFTTTSAATVQSVSWERTIEIKELKPTDKENWRDQIPAAGKVGTCEKKIRKTQEEPAPNAEKVCGTPYVVDQGTGAGKVVQKCEYKVYDDWCKFTLDEWSVVNKATAKGTDLNPQWSPVNLQSKQQEGNRSETYRVTFDVDGKRYTYNAKNSDDFLKFTSSSRWTIRVDAFGAVTSVEAQ